MLHVLLTGGGTGGHIFPLVAVANELKNQHKDVEIVYLGPKSSLNGAFRERGIKTYSLASSKWRRYTSILNFFDVFKFAFSLVQSIFKLLFLMPDVVFSKGGPGALAVIIVARFYFIPVVIHESDSIPGLTNTISGKFASKIAISFEESAKYFPNKKLAFTGNPTRPDLFINTLSASEAKEVLGFNPNEPLLFVIGGSQGAQIINNFIFDNLKTLCENIQIYHQVGPRNVRDTEAILSINISSEKKFESERYKYVGFLDGEEMKTAFSAADIVLSRAGSGSISEIAGFRKPAILVPLANAANNHQRENAYAYERAGGCVVVEENNFSIHIILRELKNLMQENRIIEIKNGAGAFFKRDAASTIAREVALLGLKQDVLTE